MATILCSFSTCFLFIKHSYWLEFLRSLYQPGLNYSICWMAIWRLIVLNEILCFLSARPVSKCTAMICPDKHLYQEERVDQILTSCVFPMLIFIWPYWRSICWLSVTSQALCLDLGKERWVTMDGSVLLKHLKYSWMRESIFIKSHIKNCYKLLSICYGANTLLSTSCELSHKILIVTLRDSYSYHIYEEI